MRIAWGCGGGGVTLTVQDILSSRWLFLIWATNQNNFTFLISSWKMMQNAYVTQIDYQLGGNREMDQLYMTSQVSNITRKTTFSPISWHVISNFVGHINLLTLVTSEYSCTECTNSALPSIVLESICPYLKLILHYFTLKLRDLTSPRVPKFGRGNPATWNPRKVVVHDFLLRTSRSGWLFYKGRLVT